MKAELKHSNGFTLIEILVVLALLGLIATMLPQGLNNLYARSSHQALVQETIVAARDCTIIAQQQQRSVRLGSQACPLPSEVGGVGESELMPVFHADGTASHTAHIVVREQKRQANNATVIVIDKLTANVRVQTDEQ